MDIARPDIAKKKKRRSIIFGSTAAVLIIAAIVAVLNIDVAQNTVSRDQIWISEVREGDMTRTVEGIGSLVAEDAQWIGARTSGSVQTVHVLPGNWVDAGDAIVTLSNPELEQASSNARLELDVSRAELTSARARLQVELLAMRAGLKQLEEQAQMARIDADIAAQLHAEDLASDLDNRKAKIRTRQLDARLKLEKERLEFRESSIEPELAVSKTRVDQAQARYELVAEQVEALLVKASSSGILQKLTLEAGMQVAAGGQIAQVADPTKLKAVLRISEIQARSLAPGQGAEVNTRTSGKVLGKVSRIDPNVETGTVAVDIRFDAPLPEGCRADQTVDGVVTLDHLGSIVFVERPPSVLEGEQTRIFKLSDDGNSARRVMTQFGKASVATIQIVSGLYPGDKVIISDTSRWSDMETINLK